MNLPLMETLVRLWHMQPERAIEIYEATQEALYGPIDHDEVDLGRDPLAEDTVSSETIQY